MNVLLMLAGINKSYIFNVQGQSGEKHGPCCISVISRMTQSIEKNS